MTRCYVETSAAAKLLIREAESPAMIAWANNPANGMVATHLLETELRRLGIREGLPVADVTRVLERVRRYDLSEPLFREAGILPGPSLRSLDALHVAAALRLNVDALVTYDQRMIEAAHAVGLATLSPS